MTPPHARQRPGARFTPVILLALAAGCGKSSPPGAREVVDEPPPPPAVERPTKIEMH